MTSILEMCSVSTNGDRASLANLKLTIGSFLVCSFSVKNLVNCLNLGDSQLIALFDKLLKLSQCASIFLANN